MKKLFLIFALTLSCSAFANYEIILANQPTGLTNLYAVAEQAGTKYPATVATPEWDNTPTTGEWGNYDIPLTEDAVFVGTYYGNMPALPAGMIKLRFYQGDTPAYTDTFIDAVEYYWTGTYLLEPSSILTVESTDASDYLDGVVDDVWDDLASTHQSNGTMGYFLEIIRQQVADSDPGNLKTVIATAQADLDTLTGADGVTLATSQPNYAPATAAALATAQADLDTITDSGVDLKSTGLDNISADEVIGVATTFKDKLIQVWQRFFYKATSTSTALTTYQSDGTTPNTTQTVSDDGTTQTVTAAAAE